MTTILHINSSVRGTDSVSRTVTQEFLTKWQSTEPGTAIVERDLVAQPLPHLTGEIVGAFFTPADQRSPEQAKLAAQSDALVKELFAADVIVIGAPMYNFSVSSALKAWIDHVARAGQTFKYTEAGPVGLVTGKKVYIFTSRGGVYSEGPAKVMDFHEPYLRAVLGFIGITDITFVHTEGLGMGEEAVAKALSKTRNVINELLAA